MSRPLVAVVDYGMGNRRSVEKALEHVGARATITADPGLLGRADGLVLPGVGAFPKGMANLRERGLDRVLHSRVADGTPLLGVCLGMQMLFDSSVELEPAAGLGLIPGEVTPLAGQGRRLPHIGWNTVRLERACPLTDGLGPGEVPFYHVHSYAARPRDPADVVASAEYGERFATIVQRGIVFGVQFHPEKSSRDGLALLARFVEIVAAKRAAGRAAATAA